MSDKRDKSIDLAKGIGIVLVFMGHINFPETVVNIINAFHMPLFFVCSGYLYDSKYDRLSTRDFIKKKAKSLLYPYYFLGSIIVVYNSFINLFILRNFTYIQLLKRILALLLGSFLWENNYEYIGTLWFLPALFCAQVVFHIISRNTKSNKGRIITTFIITIFAFLLAHFIVAVNNNYDLPINLRLPLCLDIALVSVIFILFGYLIKAIKLNPITNLISGVISLLLGILLSTFNSSVGVLYLRFGNQFIYVISAMLSCFGIILLCKSMCVICKNRNIIIDSFALFGKRSLLLMAANLYVLSYTHRILELIRFDNPVSQLVLTFSVALLLAEIVTRKMYWLYNYDAFKQKFRINKGIKDE